jgi:hypothetical protein
MPSSWDFWDPFAPSSSRSPAGHADWDDDDDAATTVPDAPAPAPPVTTTAARNQAPPPAPSVVTTTTSAAASELTVVALPRAGGAGKKDLAEIATELDEYFLKAADAGARVAALLEAPICELPDANNSLPGKRRHLIHSFFLPLSLTFHQFLTNSSMLCFFREGAELWQELEADGVVVERRRRVREEHQQWLLQVRQRRRWGRQWDPQPLLHRREALRLGEEALS